MKTFPLKAMAWCIINKTNIPEYIHLSKQIPGKAFSIKVAIKLGPQITIPAHSTFAHSSCRHRQVGGGVGGSCGFVGAFDNAIHLIRNTHTHSYTFTRRM